MNSKDHPGPSQTSDDPQAMAEEPELVRERRELRRKQLEIIAKVSKSVTGTLDLNRLLKRITSLVHKEFGYPFVHIFLVHYVPQTVEFGFGSGARAKDYKDVKVSFDIQSPIGLIPRAVRTRQTQLSNDVANDPLYLLYKPEDAVTNSELVVPLVYGDQILGVLDVQSDKINAFGPEDIEVLETLSAHIAIAINNANMYRSEVWRRQGAESLRDIALLLAQNIELEELYQTVFKKMQDLLPSTIASIWLFETVEKGKKPTKLHLVSSRTTPKSMKKPKDISVDISDVWFSEVLDEDQASIRLTGDKTDPFFQRGYLDEKFSAIAAPLSTGGKQLGVLLLHENSFGRYGNEARNITASFAGYAAVAIENSHLSAESVDQAWVSTILLQVALATQTLTTIPDLIETIGELTIALIGGRMGGILVPQDHGYGFRMPAYYGKISQKQRQRISTAVFNEDIFSRIRQDEIERSIPATEFSAKFQKMFNLRESDIVLLFPLVAHNQTMGILMHVNKSDVHHTDPEKILGKQRFTLLRGIAQQTAINLQNIHLVNERQEESYIASVLLQISNYFVSSGSLSRALELLCESLYNFIGAEDVLILERNEDGSSFVRSLLSQELSKEEEKALQGKKYPREIYDSLEQDGEQHALYIKPYAWYQQLKLESPQSDQSKNNDLHTLIAPLSMPAEEYGLLLVNLRNLKENDHRKKLLVEIAAQIASAVQNNHLQYVQNLQILIDREFQLARQIQKTFLPEKMPDIPGYEIAVQWQTARDVGGDFYDVFDVKPGYTGLVIADVSDKGLPASLYMTVSRTLIRAIALEDLTPAQTLERVNHLLQLDSTQGFFVTAFYGVLEQATGKMEYCIAGHNPPYFLSYAQEKVSQFPRGGIALGAMDPIQLPNETIQFEHGDACALFTDGITETFDPRGLPFGNQRFERALAKGINASAQDILDIVEQDVALFRAEAPTSDDTTLLVIKRLHD